MRDTAEQRAHEQAHKKGSDTDHPRQALTPGHPGEQRRGSQPTNNSQQKRTTARSTAIMARKQQRVRPTKSTSREEQQWRARQSPLSMTTPSSRQRRSPHRTDNGAARGRTDAREMRARERTRGLKLGAKHTRKQKWDGKRTEWQTSTGHPGGSPSTTPTASLRSPTASSSGR